VRYRAGSAIFSYAAAREPDDGRDDLPAQQIAAADAVDCAAVATELESVRLVSYMPTQGKSNESF
jgi:hypothetical protein